MRDFQGRGLPESSPPKDQQLDLLQFLVVLELAWEVVLQLELALEGQAPVARL
jgi:hypothetical protein